MASPLEFTLEGLTPEQQKALKNYRPGGAAAAAPPGGASEFGRPPGAPISSRAGPGRPSAEARAIMQQPAASTIRQGAATRPVATPAASPVAAAPRTLGQRALQFARGATSLNPVKNPLMRGGGLLIGGTALAEGAFDTAGRTQEEMSQRQADLTTRQLGLNPENLPGRIVRGGLDVAQSGFERLLGMLPGFGPAPAGPGPEAPIAPSPAGAPAAPAAPTPRGLESPEVTALQAGSPEARKAGAFLESRSVPASGRGVLRNDQTGELTTFDAQPRLPIASAAATGARAATPEFTAPELGTQGGIFTNLARFQKDLGQTAMAQAGEKRAYNRAAAEQAAGLEASKLATEQGQAAFKNALEIAGLGIRQQTADAATAAAAARAVPRPVVQSDITGPLIIDPVTGTARRPTVVPDFAEFDAKMREDSRNADLTPEQMKQAYQEQYGR
jgi:hypothetical protein